MTDFVEGDTGSAIEFTCVDSNNFEPIDLTDYTATLQWRKNKILQSKLMQKVDNINGIVRYIFISNELTAGTMSFDVVLTNTSTTQTLTCKDLIRLDVRKRV
jgi:hypothetical protein